MPLPPHNILLCFAPLFGVYTKFGLDPELYSSLSLALFAPIYVQKPIYANA